MKQAQLEWLLKILQKNASTFHVMYKTQIQIPNIIMLEKSEIQSWFRLENGILTQVNENVKDLSIVKNHYLNFLKQINDPALKQKYENELFYIQMKSFGKIVTKKIKKIDFLNIFNSLHDYQTYTNTWTKIFDCFPHQNDKNLVFLDIMYSYSNPQININIKKLQADSVQPQDYLPNDQEKFIKAPKLKDIKPIQKCVSQTIYQKCEILIKSMVKYIERKIQEKLYSFELEAIMDLHNNLWIINADNIQIYNEALQQSEVITEKIKPIKQIQISQKPKQCQGYYCKYNFFIQQQKIPFNNNFISSTKQHLWDQNNIITYKSVFLDLIEREKLKERISKLTSLDVDEIEKIPQNQLIKIREYISMVVQNKLKEFQNIGNLYKKINLCINCQNVYFNIDNLRINNQQNFIDKQQIIDLVQSFSNTKQINFQKTKPYFSSMQKSITNFNIKTERKSTSKKLTQYQSFFPEKQVILDQIQNDLLSYDQIIDRKIHFHNIRSSQKTQKNINSKINKTDQICITNTFNEKQLKEMVSIDIEQHKFILEKALKFQKNCINKKLFRISQERKPSSVQRSDLCISVQGSSKKQYLQN